MNLSWAKPISNHPKAIKGADIKIMVFLPYFPDKIPPVVHVNTPINSVTSVVTGLQVYSFSLVRIFRLICKIRTKDVFRVNDSFLSRMLAPPGF